jgi:hypothetical protein
VSVLVAIVGGRVDMWWADGVDGDWLPKAFNR